MIFCQHKDQCDQISCILNMEPLFHLLFSLFDSQEYQHHIIACCAKLHSSLSYKLHWCSWGTGRMSQHLIQEKHSSGTHPCQKLKSCRWLDRGAVKVPELFALHIAPSVRALWVAANHWTGHYSSEGRWKLTLQHLAVWLHLYSAVNNIWANRNQNLRLPIQRTPFITSITGPLVCPASDSMRAAFLLNVNTSSAALVHSWFCNHRRSDHS